FEDLQKLWQTNPPQQSLDFEAVLDRARRRGRDLLTHLRWHLLAFGVAIFAVIFALAYFSFHTWTSYIGLILVGLSFTLAFALKFNTYFLVKKLSGQSLESPSAYLTQLRRYSERVHVQNTSSFRLYGMGIALALAFFSLEIYFVIPFFWFMFLMGFVVL